MAAGLSRLSPIISLCSASWLLTSGSIGNLSSCPRSQMRRVRAWWEWLESNQRFPCCCFTDRTYLPTSLLEPLYRAFKAHGVLPLNYIPIECRSVPGRHPVLNRLRGCENRQMWFPWREQRELNPRSRQARPCRCAAIHHVRMMPVFPGCHRVIP